MMTSIGVNETDEERSTYITYVLRNKPNHLNRTVTFWRKIHSEDFHTLTTIGIIPLNFLSVRICVNE